MYVPTWLRKRLRIESPSEWFLTNSRLNGDSLGPEIGLATVAETDRAVKGEGPTTASGVRLDTDYGDVTDANLEDGVATTGWKLDISVNGEAGNAGLEGD